MSFSMINCLPAHRSRRIGTGPGPARSSGGRSCRRVCRRGRCASAAARSCSAWAAGPAGPSYLALNRLLMVQIFMVGLRYFYFVSLLNTAATGAVWSQLTALWHLHSLRSPGLTTRNRKTWLCCSRQHSAPQCYYEQGTFSTFCWLSLQF